jgi:hypothetical protein
MVDLLQDPEGYARRAIAAIETQLETAVSTTRKARLTSKLNQWKKALVILSEDNANKEESSQTDSITTK